jgi:hypothetical protein
MNTDIRISVNFWKHLKTVKLERRLGLEGVKALTLLWMWTARNRPNGDLLGLDAEDLEIAAEWRGKPGTLIESLAALAWLDEENGHYKIHDWTDHNPWAAEADSRSDSARFLKLAQVNKAAYIELLRLGVTSLSKSEFKQWRNSVPVSPHQSNNQDTADASEPHSVSQSVPHSVPQSVSHSASQSASHSAAQSEPHSVAQSGPHSAPLAPAPFPNPFPFPLPNPFPLPTHYVSTTPPTPPLRTPGSQTPEAQTLGAGTQKPDARPKTQFADFVSMTNDEHSSLVARLGEAGTARCIEILDNYKGSRGKQYQSDYRAILNWVVQRYEEEQAKQEKQANAIRRLPQLGDGHAPRTYEEAKALMERRKRQAKQTRSAAIDADFKIIGGEVA